MKHILHHFLLVICVCFFGLFTTSHDTWAIGILDGKCYRSSSKPDDWPSSNEYISQYDSYCMPCSGVVGDYLDRCGYNNAPRATRYVQCKYMPTYNSRNNPHRHAQGSSGSRGGPSCDRNCEAFNLSSEYYGLESSYYRYPVFDNGQLLYCNTCPKGDDAGRGSCGDSGFSCNSNFVRTEHEYYPASPIYEEQQYTSRPEIRANEDCVIGERYDSTDRQRYHYKICFDRGGSTPKKYYTCECSAENTYTGYRVQTTSEWDGEITTSLRGNPTCHTCPEGYYPETSCSNSTGFSCKDGYNYVYLTAYMNYDDTSTWSTYGKYECTMCPSFENASDFHFNSSYSNVQYITNNGELIWRKATTPAERCVADTPEREDKQLGNDRIAKYKLTNIRPNDDCTSINRTDELPDRSTFVVNSCTYTYVKTYTSTPKGYYAKNNSTLNPTLEQCPNGYYKDTTTGATCTHVPANSSSTADRTDFICDQYYYRKDNTCVPCPYYNSDFSDWQPNVFSNAPEIFLGVNSADKSFATHSVADYDKCTLTPSTKIEISGTTNYGTCTIHTNRQYVLDMRFSQSAYCTISRSQFIGNICSDVVHCSGNPCGGCNAGGFAADVYDAQIQMYDSEANYNPEAMSMYFPNLYMAQKFLRHLMYYGGHQRCVVSVMRVGN